MGINSYSTHSNQDNKTNILAFIAVALLLIGMGTGIYQCAKPKITFATVSSTSWEYKISVQERTIRHGSGWGEPWEDEVISKDCSTRFYGMTQCNCVTRTHTTGKVTRTSTSCSSCPSFRKWCEYDYVTWPVVKQWVTNGNDHNTYWPKYEELTINQRLVRDESYDIKFSVKGEKKEFDYKPNGLTKFKELSVGDTTLIKAYFTGSAEPATDYEMEQKNNE